MRIHVSLEKNKNGNFGIELSNPCYFCENPTLFIMNVHNPFTFILGCQGELSQLDKFSRDFLQWYENNKDILCYNEKRMKWLGPDLKFRRVCLGCYTCPPSLHKNREIGHQAPKTLSLNHKQVCAHFEDFNKYRSTINGSWIHSQVDFWSDDDEESS